MMNPTPSTEPLRRKWKIAHLIINKLCVAIALIEFRRLTVEDISLLSMITGQIPCRIAFIVITAIITLASLGVLVVHRKNIITPKNEAIYYSICSALLAIISISLLARYGQLLQLGIPNEVLGMMAGAGICGLIDAVVYAIPAVKILK